MRRHTFTTYLDIEKKITWNAIFFFSTLFKLKYFRFVGSVKLPPPKRKHSRLEAHYMRKIAYVARWKIILKRCHSYLELCIIIIQGYMGAARKESLRGATKKAIEFN